MTAQKVIIFINLGIGIYFALYTMRHSVYMGHIRKIWKKNGLLIVAHSLNNSTSNTIVVGSIENGAPTLSVGTYTTFSYWVQ